MILPKKGNYFISRNILVSGNEFSIITKGDIHYLRDKNGKIKRYKPWLGDYFSFPYYWIMENSIFPNKFNADTDRHLEILKSQLGPVHHANLLEIATGSGNAAFYLNQDVSYKGTDISPGLLKIAFSRFQKSGFNKVDLYLAPAEDLPFKNNAFD